MTRTADRLLLAAAVLFTITACGQASKSTSAVSSALSSAVASSTDAAGTLLCTPAQAQIDACTGKAAGGACELTPPSGTATVAGTCRTAIGGTTVACAPNPPAPPQELVDACTGKASGATCQVTEAFGNTRDGVCITARDGATLVCGRVHTPPQAAIDACATLAAGATCSMPAREGTGTVAGVCSLGPASTGPLACAPHKDLLPHGEQACVGLAEGATCTLGRSDDAVSGSCLTPAAGSAAVCVVACSELRGRFECGPGGRGGHGGPGDHGGPGGPSGPSGPTGPTGPTGPGMPGMPGHGGH
jgi:hypothetical protein